LNASFLDKKPYLIDAVIGNSRILASLGRNGRMYRLWWPHIDTPQHLDEMRAGIRLEGVERTDWFDSAEAGWTHAASYVKGTNVFEVTATCKRLPISVKTTDFAAPGENFLVRDFTFTNMGDAPVSFAFVYYSSVHAEEISRAQTTQFVASDEALDHFHKRIHVAVGSSVACCAYQAGAAWGNAQSSSLNGSVIDMQPDGALSWTVADLAPSATVSIPVYVALGHSQPEALDALRKAKRTSAADWADQTVRYWRELLASAKPCPVDHEAIRELYERSLLAMRLMADERTGAIIAAPEADEMFARCGGYGFCWGRDAAFITTALDKAGWLDMSDRFYAWTLTAQEADGSWQQRHYHDGSLAPSWGLQIDEGASILWGMKQHYDVLPAGSKAGFLASVRDAVIRGADFLADYVDTETGLPLPSHDLWEERIGEHSYSAAAVFAGLTAAAEMASVLGEPVRAEKWRDVADSIRHNLLTSCWDEQRHTFLRGLKLQVNRSDYEDALRRNVLAAELHDGKGYMKYVLEQDRIIDVSLLGISVPFGAIEPGHPHMADTADAIERALTVPGVGGIKRYENDAYIGGNPWILTTLWLAQYRIASGRPELALPLIDWAVRHRTEFGLLPEQIDKTTGATAWIVPLTWSHAMFILAVHMLADQPNVAQTGLPSTFA